MNTGSTNPCPQCGQPISPGGSGLKGLCPHCLALVAFGPEGGSGPTVVLGESQGAGATEGGSNSEAPRPLLPPVARYFGDYELLAEIARGGMGVVYKARQKSLNRVVAVKMILAGQLASEGDVRRFHTEAEAAANLQHPNIVAIHEVGEHEGLHYFSMDYVEGQNLAERVRDQGPLAPNAAAELVQRLAEAVQYANQRGILHRDLKPHNVLMDEEGQPRITDFGLAKQMDLESSLTHSGAVLGSPGYMPPEQAAGHLDQVGPASDVYGLGAILYHCLTGRAPFKAETPLATVALVLDQEAASPQGENEAVPTDLATICLKCLAKDPGGRYPTARALSEELGRFLRHEPIQAKRPGALRRGWNWTQRHPWVLAGLSSIVVLALACVAFGFWENHRRFVWLLQHGSLGSWEGYYLPVLEFWSVAFPVLCLSCYFGGGFFRRRYAQRDRRRGGTFRLLWVGYVALGMVTLASGLWGLFSVVKLAVWLRSTASGLTALMSAPWMLCLVWLGAYTLWEGAGSHESALFGGLVNESVQRYLRYHPNRWTLWEIVTCTMTGLMSYALTVAWLNRLTESFAAPAGILDLPYILNFGIAAVVYPLALMAVVKSRRALSAAGGVALGVSVSALLVSGRGAGCLNIFVAVGVYPLALLALATRGQARRVAILLAVAVGVSGLLLPGKGAGQAAAIRSFSQVLWSGSFEKTVMVCCFPLAFFLIVAAFETAKDRRQVLSWTAWVGVFIVSVFLAFAVLEGVSGGNDAALGQFALPAAGLLALPVVILRSRLGPHGVAKRQASERLSAWLLVKAALIPIGVFLLLLLAAVGIEDWRGARAWAQAQAAWKAKHRPARLEDLIPPPVPDASNFWKAPIVQAWLPEKGKNPTRAWPTIPPGYAIGGLPYDLALLRALPKVAPPTAPDAPSLTGLRKWLAQWDGPLEALRRAGERPYAQMDPPKYDRQLGCYNPLTLDIPTLIAFRILAQFSASRALVHLLTAEPDQALADLKTLKVLMRGLEIRPGYVVSFSIHAAIARLWADTIHLTLSEGLWPAANLAALQRELAGINLVEGLHNTLIETRNNYCEWCELIVRAPLKDRLTVVLWNNFLEPSDVVRAAPLKDRPVVALWNNILGLGDWVRIRVRPELNFSGPSAFLLLRGWVRQNQATISRVVNPYLAALEAAPDRINATAIDRAAQAEKRECDTGDNVYNRLAEFFLSRYDRIAKNVATSQALTDLAVIAIALERFRNDHGAYPETLDELTPAYAAKLPRDVISGQPYHYHRTAPGAFKLYGVGWNERDDGGVRLSTEPLFFQGNAKDWVWQ